MTFHVLNKKIGFGFDSGIRLFHYLMFHGSSTRGGLDHLDSPIPFLSDKNLAPLFVKKNVYRLAHLWQPALHLVASEEVRMRLQSFPSLRWNRVHFEKLFTCPYEEHDFSFYEKKAFVKEEIFVNDAPHSPDFERLILPYYELIVARHQDVHREFTDLDVITAEVHSIEREPMSAAISDPLLERFPLLWHRDGLLCSDAIFRVVSPYLDRTYFHITTIDY